MGAGLDVEVFEICCQGFGGGQDDGRLLARQLRGMFENHIQALLGGDCQLQLQLTAGAGSFIQALQVAGIALGQQTQVIGQILGVGSIVIKVGHTQYSWKVCESDNMDFFQGAIKIMTTVEKNIPELWRDTLPQPQPNGHKYSRGHLIVLGGVEMTGAARLTAEAGMRAGAGVCTIVSSARVRDIYLKGAPHVMFEAYRGLASFARHLEDPRRTAIVMGPGAGRARALRGAVLAALKTGKPAVLDADALNVFEGASEALFQGLHPACILTPHEGEFARLFGSDGGDRVERTVQAAKRAGCVVVLKGAQTVIVAPDGRVVVNEHASPWLATAGAGDVLAGIMGGLMAPRSMESFDAACAAVWIHGEAGLRFGPGLTAPDLVSGIPAVLRGLLRDFA